MGSNPWDFSQTMMAADEANFRDRQYANQSELRQLQLEDLRQQMGERKSLYDLRAGLPGYIEQNKASLYPTTGARIMPGDTPQMIEANAEGANMGGTPMAPVQQPQASVYNIPAKETYGSLAGKYYIDKGYPEKGLPLIAEGRKTKQEDFKEMTTTLETALKYHRAGNKKAAKMIIDAAKEMYPAMKDIDLSEDTKTGLILMQKKAPDGTIMTVTIDPETDKPVGTPHYTNPKEETTKLGKYTEADKKVAGDHGFVLDDPKGSRLYDQFRASPEGRKAYSVADQPKRQPPSELDIALKQERLKQAQSMENRMSESDKVQYRGLQSQLNQIENSENVGLADLKVIGPKRTQIESRMRTIEQKYISGQPARPVQPSVTGTPQNARKQQLRGILFGQ